MQGVKANISSIFCVSKYFFGVIAFGESKGLPLIAFFCRRLSHFTPRTIKCTAKGELLKGYAWSKKYLLGDCLRLRTSYLFAFGLFLAKEEVRGMQKKAPAYYK